MSVSIGDFWRLLAESRLLAPEQCRQLAEDFAQVKGAAEQASAKTLGEWLVARNVLSKYQATILLAGRPGPFLYGKYKVYDRVEKGQLAGQFRAVHAPTGHPVLLKFLTGPVIADQARWAQAANDTLAACGMVSPHVQRWFEPVDLQAFKFLVSEDLRGNTLDERLALGRFPPAEACRIARLAAIGLAQMHACGRVHGDVRPPRVLLESIPGHPGNAKLLYDAHEPPGVIDLAQLTPDSRLELRADYFAPELATPGRVPDPLSDIYALGCTLYAMLTGNPPFAGGTEHAGGTVQQKMMRHASEPIRPLEQFGVPQPLAQLVAFLMAKNASVRFQSAALVAEQLAPFVEPAARYAQPPAPPPTLANFESFVRQKQTQLASGAGRSAAVPVGVAVSPSPAPFRSDREHLSQMAAAAAASPSPGAAGFAVPGAEKPATSSTAEVILRRKEEQQRKTLILGLVAAGVLVVAAIVGINMLGRQTGDPDANAVAKAGGDDAPQPIPRPQPPVTSAAATKGPTPSPVTPTTTTNPPDGAAPPTSAKGSGPPSVTEIGFRQEIVPDDGSLLWASPTNGVPVAFRCVPPEAQVYLIVRPADLLASGEGAKVLAALGPEFAAERTKWEAAAGFKLEEVEQLIVALHNTDAKFPRTSFVVKTKEVVATEPLLARWGNPAEQKEGSATYYAGPVWAYYVSNSPAEGEAERTFLMAEPRDVKEVAKATGNPPPLFRDVERLRRSIDGDRHVSLLAYPPFFFNDDGEPLFAGPRRKVREPVSWLLGDGLQAALVSLHFGEEFYLEMRMLGSLDNEPYKLSSDFRERLDQIPRRLEDYFVELTPPPYWKKIAFRYPGMVRALHENLRVGVENEQAVVNAVLPGAAAHNLVLGGELLVSTAPGTAAVATVEPPKVLPKTIAEALQLKTTYSFDSQSLEFAMRDLALDVNDQLKGAPVQFGIKILGPDLEKDGITRNMSVTNFKQEDTSIADILTALVLKTSTAKGPTDPEQKLIWVVADDPETPDKQTVLITTRAAAAAKKYEVPQVFVAK